MDEEIKDRGAEKKKKMNIFIYLLDYLFYP